MTRRPIPRGGQPTSLPRSGAADDVGEALILLGLPGAKAQPIRGGDVNRHWRLTHPSGRWVLRRYQPWRPLAAIAYEHQVLACLDTASWPVAAARPNHADVTVIQVAGHAWAVFPLLPGRHPRPPRTDAELRRHGAILAQFHHTTRELVDVGPRPGYPPLTAPPSPDADDPVARTYPDLAATILTEHALLRRQLHNLDAATLPQTVLHGDWYDKNLLYQDGKLTGVLDLDDTRLDARVTDLALAISYLPADAVARFLAGYQEHTALQQRELDAIPLIQCARLLAHIAFCRRLAASGADILGELRSTVDRVIALRLTVPHSALAQAVAHEP